MSRSRGRAAARVLLVIVILTVVAAGAGTGGYVVARQVRANLRASNGHPVVATPAVIGRATAPPTSPVPSAAAPVPVPAALAQVLAAPSSAPALGARLLAYVADGESGEVLFDKLSSTASAPASTAKLLTAAALLAVRPPTARLTTRVALGQDGTAYLIGGGDPTLTGAPVGQPGAYPDAARISDLAAQLTKAHIHPSRVVVDDTLFSGAAVSTAWEPSDVPTDYASPITAVMADGGRGAPQDVMRSASPDLAAAAELAAALGTPRLPVGRGVTPTQATPVASVASAPVAELIDQMLQASDNVIAECLARQVALARGAPATFLGAAAAIRAVLAGLGADPGAGMLDGSGLAAGDRLTVAALGAVLHLVIGTANPALHAIVTALPVAGWSGTLADRYVAGAAAGGAGVVRAKTGTLTSVSTLAGIAYDKDGRMLVFAFIADRVGADAAATATAEGGLDDLAAALTSCGCR